MGVKQGRPQTVGPTTRRDFGPAPAFGARDRRQNRGGGQIQRRERVTGKIAAPVQEAINDVEGAKHQPERPIGLRTVAVQLIRAERPDRPGNIRKQPRLQRGVVLGRISRGAAAMRQPGFPFALDLARRQVLAPSPPGRQDAANTTALPSGASRMFQSFRPGETG